MRFFNFGEIVGEYTGKLNKNIMNLTKEEFKKLTKKTLSIADVSSSFYSDCNDYSHLKVNSDQFPEHEECVMCGSTQVTITDDADICHDCGYVYT